jgi:hypothetical protein
MEDKTTETAVEEVKKQDAIDPWDILLAAPGAPTKATVEAWKKQAPNGVIRLLILGNKRIYLVRGVTGQELLSAQNAIPENLGAGLAPEARMAKVDLELQLIVASKCTLWTSDSPDGRLTIEQLRTGSAGRPSTLFNLVTVLSDFVEPEAFQVISTEL